MTPGVFYNCLEICVTPLKPLRFNGFSFDGLITPTLKAAGSNPVGRTKKISLCYMAEGNFLFNCFHR